jgi:hypothetical protein
VRSQLTFFDGLLRINNLFLILLFFFLVVLSFFVGSLLLGLLFAIFLL